MGACHFILYLPTASKLNGFMGYILT